MTQQVASSQTLTLRSSVRFMAAFAPHHRSPTSAMEPAGQDLQSASRRPELATVPLCLRPNASPFWIMLLLSSGTFERRMIEAVSPGLRLREDAERGRLSAPGPKRTIIGRHETVRCRDMPTEMPRDQPAAAQRLLCAGPLILPIMESEYPSHTNARVPASSALVGSVNSTSGKRTLGDMRPNRLSAYLSGAGLLSRNSAAVNCANGIASRWALAMCPCLHSRNMSRHRPGATLDVTEMQPSPP